MASDIKLNKQQREAVEHGEGPLLIIAGAGTGKTAVITERVKHLISKGVNPEEILALTFTEKASQEMQERIDVALPLSYGEMWIMTFHGFCDQILRDRAVEIGLSPNFKLMTQAESIDFMKKNLYDFNLDYFRPLGNPNKFISALLTHFSRLQDETVTPKEYLEWTTRLRESSGEAMETQLENIKWKELADAYKTYDELKIKNGKFDFGDLIIKTIDLFKKRQNVLLQYQKKFKYILVDEFQDTNYAQNELLKLLAGEEANIAVVGDDDQSIYKFRGAAISNLVQFRVFFPKSKLVVLTKNYRSTQNILDASYQLIKNNNPERLEVVENINKKLKAEVKPKGERPEFYLGEKVNDESEFVAKKIIRLAKDKYHWRNFAILVRANNHADPFIKEFEARGIPFQFLGPSRLFEKEEVVDLIVYLKVLYNVYDNNSFYRLLTSQIYGISTIDLIKITHFARQNSLSLYEVVASKDKDLTLSQDTQKQIDKIISILDSHLKLINRETAGYLLLDYIKASGIYERILKEKDDLKIKNISIFFEKIKDYESQLLPGSQETPAIYQVVDYVDLLSEVGETPLVSDGSWQENNAVNIMTLHSAKGLEFPVVFLVNLVSDRFPSRNRSEVIPIHDELIKEVLPVGNFHLQEERRLFYVGMTRAQEKLYLTAANFYGDVKRKKKISPFVFEALGEITNKQSTITKQSPIINFSNQKNLTHNSQPTTYKLNVDTLSVSQIETFDICPLHYKLKYVYKLPTETSAPISFGVTIHCALRDYYRAVKDGAKPTEKLILNCFKQNWIDQGYGNKKRRRQYFEKGESYLRKFLDAGFKNLGIPEVVEEKFKINLGNNLKIVGTFDRVTILPNGKIEIVDYKTGEKIPTQKEVDKDLQLGVYALAATKIKSEIFNKKPEDIKLALYYFEGQKKIETTRTQKDLEKLEKELFKKREEIENSAFTCSNHYFCQNGCEFTMFCKSEN